MSFVKSVPLENLKAFMVRVGGGLGSLCTVVWFVKSCMKPRNKLEISPIVCYFLALPKRKNLNEFRETLANTTRIPRAQKSLWSNEEMKEH